MKTLILVACLALPSCSVLAKAEELVDHAKATYAEAVAKYEEAKVVAQQADLDGSGKIDSMSELYALGSGLLGLLGIGMATSANKKRKANATELFGQIGTLREKVATTTEKVAADTKAITP